jgi:hypothetical protein
MVCRQPGFRPEKPNPEGLGAVTSADTNAAIHISRAAVIPPIVWETALPSRQGQAAALESVRYMTKGTAFEKEPHSE